MVKVVVPQTFQGRGLDSRVARDLETLASLVQKLFAEPILQQGTLPKEKRFATQADLAGLIGALAQNPIGNTSPDPLLTTLPTGNGTVSSVALSAPSIFTVSGSPVATTGTLSFSLNTQSANRMFAGPTSGAAAAPTFRVLVAADIDGLAVGTTTQNTGRFTVLTADTSLTVAGAKISAGNGTPEGVVVGSVGDLFLRRDGGASTTLYVKESGSATNTGWVAK